MCIFYFSYLRYFWAIAVDMILRKAPETMIARIIVRGYGGQVYPALYRPPGRFEITRWWKYVHNSVTNVWPCSILFIKKVTEITIHSMQKDEKIFRNSLINLQFISSFRITGPKILTAERAH
jgi:hypothetical protein